LKEGKYLHQKPQEKKSENLNQGGGGSQLKKMSVWEDERRHSRKVPEELQFKANELRKDTLLEDRNGGN